jgi:putative membrane protein
MIAFGFVVERAGLLIQALRPELVQARQLDMTFWLGLALIVLGAVTSAYSARQYGVILRSLTPAEFPPGYAAKWSLAVNLAVAVLGLALAGALLFWRTA